MKKINRRDFLKVAGVTVAAAGIAACSSDSSTTTTTTTSTASTTTASDSDEKEYRELTGAVMQTRNWSGLQLMIEKLAEEENIHIDMTVIEDEQYDNYIKMRVTSGESCDLIDYNQPTICGLFVPCENYLADLSDEDWVANLAAPDNLKWTDGKIYGFPFNSIAGMQGMIYNKSVFEAAGITAEPTTKDEFDEVCDKLVAAGYPAILMPSDTWVPQIWMTAGYAQSMGTIDAASDFATALTSNQDKFTNHPEFAEVIDDYGSNFTKGYVNDDWLTVEHSECIRRLGEGEAGMYYQNAVSIVSSIQTSYPETDLGVFMYPSDFNPDRNISVTSNSAGFSVNVSSDKIDLAKEVLNIWAQPEYADLYYTDGNDGFPALTTSDGGSLADVTVAVYDEYVTGGKYVKEMNNHLVDLQSLYSGTLWIYYQQVGQGKMDGTTLLETFQKDVESYLTEMQFEGYI
ncbi:MAG: extracellular solute-binding protein [Faecalibacterium sp.]